MDALLSCGIFQNKKDPASYLHGLFKSKENAAEDDTFSAEEGDILEMPSVDASIVGRSFHLSDGGRSFHLSDGEEDEAVVAGEDILSDGDKRS
jgi:hypothetical protein